MPDSATDTPPETTAPTQEVWVGGNFNRYATVVEEAEETVIVLFSNGWEVQVSRDIIWKERPMADSVIAIPRNNHELSLLMLRLSSKRRMIAAAQAKVAARKQAIEATFSEQIHPDLLAVEQMEAAVAAYLLENEAVLIETEGNPSRTLRIPGGTAEWAVNPHKATLKDVEKVKEVLKRLGLEQFLRTTVVPDKEAMLADEGTRKLAATVPGITIGQDETLTVTPKNGQQPMKFNIASTRKKVFKKPQGGIRKRQRPKSTKIEPKGK